jgi:methylmalonyl-CoA mutase N-terminal domain/subunit
VRAGRSQSAGPKKLAALEGEASGSDNLMPPIVDAAGAYATVGEISDCLRGAFGECREL